MRVAYSDVGVFSEKSEKGASFGISLGYDFCAEHEFGASTLRRLLGVSPNVGIEDFLNDFKAADSVAPSSLDDFRIKVSKNILHITGTFKISEASSFCWRKGDLKFAQDLYKKTFRDKFNKKNAKSFDFTFSALWCASAEEKNWILSRHADKVPQLCNAVTAGESSVQLNLSEAIEFFKLFSINAADAVTYAYKQEIEKMGVDTKNIKQFKFAEDRYLTHSSWDSSEFLFLAMTAEKANIVDELYSAILAGKAYFGVTGKDNPFSRSSNVLMVQDFAQEDKDAVVTVWKEIRELSKEVISTEIVKELKAANKRYYSLRPTKREGKLVFWLNPQSQDKYNSGWFALEDLRAWAKDTGPVLKK